MPDAVVAPLRCRCRGRPTWSRPVIVSNASGGPARHSGWVPSIRSKPLTISGTPKEYVRFGASGGKVRCYFCPDCGSTVCWAPDKLPGMIGVAVGAIADPNFPAPIKSVFERSKHAWVEITGLDVEHLQQGSLPKASS